MLIKAPQIAVRVVIWKVLWYYIYIYIFFFSGKNIDPRRVYKLYDIEAEELKLSETKLSSLCFREGSSLFNVIKGHSTSHVIANELNIFDLQNVLTAEPDMIFSSELNSKADFYWNLG